MVALRPLFQYYGAKGRLAPFLAGLLPPHEVQVYVEPFAGSAAVFFAKKPAQIGTINDVNGDLIAFMRRLRDQLRALIRAIHSPCTPAPSIKPRVWATPPCRTRRWWIALWHGPDHNHLVAAFACRTSPGDAWQRHALLGEVHARCHDIVDSIRT
ncbi:DNA adenine methylase [Nonomuraea rubra]|uniref:DNA adenine methylase n=1 Tax=Nonomuraea rubra TaxID=46180 RepID=A0A7X0U6K7_9ACTN|nr:DNA adenine methylase [Nonomuraea rubra]MBB6557116.1 hypothetical protein [Nonomuraea rubra]